MKNVAYIGEFAPEIHPDREKAQLKTHYDAKNKIGWFLMKGSPRPAFTLKLLSEISSYFDDVKQEMADSSGEKYDFLVLGSDIEGVQSGRRPGLVQPLHTR